MEVGYPGARGLPPPTQTQVGRTPHKPALPATQPRASPAVPKEVEGPPGWDSPEQWGARGKGDSPQGTRLESPNPERRDAQAPHAMPTDWRPG